MSTPLRPDEIKDRLPEHYRPIWKKIAADHLNAEPVYFAEYLCRQEWYSGGEGHGLIPVGMVRTQPILVVITAIRWIRGHFSHIDQGPIPYPTGWTYDKEFVYRKQGKGFFAYLEHDDFAEWKWLTPPKKPVLKDLPFVSVTELSLAEVTVRSRNDYACVIEGQQTSLSEIDMGQGVWFTALKDAGAKMYELLRSARENKGRISGSYIGEETVRQPNSELIAQLQHLAKLREAGILSAAELEELKNRLLHQ